MLTAATARPSDVETIVKELAYRGRDMANQLRGAADLTETAAAALIADDKLLRVAQHVTVRLGWKGDQIPQAAWNACVDAYYDRMTGKA